MRLTDLYRSRKPKSDRTNQNVNSNSTKLVPKLTPLLPKVIISTPGRIEKERSIVSAAKKSPQSSDSEPEIVDDEIIPETQIDSARSSRSSAEQFHRKPSTGSLRKLIVSPLPAKRPTSSSSLAVSPSDRTGTPTPCATTSSKSARSPGQGSYPLDVYDLPTTVIRFYANKGITSIFRWQHECLNQPGVLDGHNLLFSAPTSAGKTIISDILLIRTVVRRGLKALLVLPFISLANEKVLALQSMLKHSGITVGGFMGNSLPSGHFPAIDIAVCTIEKANNIINLLIQQRKLHTLGVVVVDEVHLLADATRGPLLESLFTKLLYVNAKSAEYGDGSNATVDSAVTTSDTTDDQTKSPAGPELFHLNERNRFEFNCPPIQIVGMSATLSNLEQLATWIGARAYRSHFRPVPLLEMIKVNDKLVEVSSQRDLRDLKRLDIKVANDASCVLGLALETVLDGHGVLIFCSSKDACERLAEQLSVTINQLGTYSGVETRFVEAKQRLIATLSADRIRDLLMQLNRTSAKLDRCLARTVSFGVAFHHAGLSMEERELIEHGFKDSTLRALFATPTLSSGVNLPARRVIIRSLKVGIQPMSSLVYRQMIGRAGRQGVDSRGESVLVCDPNEMAAAWHLCKQLPQPIQSCLTVLQPSDRRDKREVGNNATELDKYELTEYLLRACLEVVANGLLDTTEQLQTYLNCTLVAQCQRPFRLEECEKLLATLCDQKGMLPTANQSTSTAVKTPSTATNPVKPFLVCIKSDDGRKHYAPSSLGNGVFSSCLQPAEALQLFGELRQAMSGLVLHCDLHLLYHTIPSNDVARRHINWSRFASLFALIEADETLRLVAKQVNVHGAFVQRAASSHLDPKRSGDARERHVRFYFALALNELIGERPLHEVCARFDLNRGDLQQLQQRCSGYAGMMSIFCRKLAWHNLAVLIKMFQDRLYFGVSAELIELMTIPCLNGRMARLLFNAGFEEVRSIAHSTYFEVERVLRCAVDSGYGTTRLISPVKKTTTTGSQAKLRTWISVRCESMDESQIAVLIVNEARALVEQTIGVHIDWDRQSKPLELLSQVSTHSNESGRKRRLSPTRDVSPDHRPEETLLASDTITKATASRNVATDMRISISSPESQSTSPVILSLYGDHAMCERSSVVVRQTASSQLSVLSALSSQSQAAEALDNQSKTSLEQSETVLFTIPAFLTQDDENSHGFCSLPTTLNVKSSIPLSTENMLNSPDTVNPSTLSVPLFEASAERINDDDTPSKRIRRHSHSDSSLANKSCRTNLLTCFKRSSQKLPSTPDTAGTSATDLKTSQSSPFEFGCTYVKRTLNSSQDTTHDMSIVHDSPFVIPDSLDEVDSACEWSEGSDPSFGDSSQTIVSTSKSQTTIRPLSGAHVISESISNSPGELVLQADSTQIKTRNFSGDLFELNTDDEQDNDDLELEQHLSTSFANTQVDRQNLSHILTSNPNKPDWLNRQLKESSAGLLQEIDQDELKVSVHEINERNVYSFINNWRNCRTFAIQIQTAAQPVKVRLNSFMNMPNLNPGDLSAIHSLAITFDRDSSVQLIRDTNTLKALQLNFCATTQALNHFRFTESRVLAICYDSKQVWQWLTHVLGMPSEAVQAIRWADCRLAAWLLWPESNEPSHSVDLIERWLTNESASKCERLWQRLSRTIKSTASERATRVRECYCSTLLPGLADWLFALLQAENLYILYRTVEHPVLFLFAEMELYGLKVDRQYLNDELARWSDWIDQLQNMVQRKSGLTSIINLASSKQVRQLLFGDHKLLCLKSNDSSAGPTLTVGSRSTGRHVLDQLRPLHELPGLVVDWRRLQQAHENGSQLLNAASERTDRVCGQYQHWICTGRVSMNAPNLLTIVKNFEVNIDQISSTVSLRRALVTDSDNYLVSADFSQLELRILACLSGETRLIRPLNTSTDVFRCIAGYVHSKDSDKVTQEERTQAKEICYSLIYGIGDKKLAEKLQLNEQRAMEFRCRFETNFPQLIAWIGLCKRRCIEQREVRTLLGRHRKLPDIESTVPAVRSSAERKAINTTIQGSAADLVKMAMLRVQKAIQAQSLKARCLLQIHDELLFEVHHNKDNLKRFVAMLNKEMPAVATKLPVHFPVCVRYGSNWSELCDYEKPKSINRHNSPLLF